MALEAVVADLVEKVERRFFGKHRGLVVDNADPEALGRLRLQVPGLLGTDVVTGWAMPCLPYGGARNEGFLFVPQVGAGVWVEFEEGDLEFPIWTGTYWSKPEGESELPRPYDVDGVEGDGVQDPPLGKILKTLKGHTIQLEDAEGEERVTIVEGTKRHLITLEKTGGIRITHGDKGHQVLLVDAGITVESATDVTIKGQNVTIKGQNVTIEAQAKLTVKGNPVHLNP